MKHPSYFSSLLKNLSHLNPSSLRLNSSIIPHFTSHFTPPSTLLLVLASASCDSLSWSWFSTYFCPALGAEELVTSQANISIGEEKSLSSVRLCATHRWQSITLPRPWDCPGKSTGVGCHCSKGQMLASIRWTDMECLMVIGEGIMESSVRFNFMKLLFFWVKNCWILAISSDIDEFNGSLKWGVAGGDRAGGTVVLMGPLSRHWYRGCPPNQWAWTRDVRGGLAAKWQVGISKQWCWCRDRNCHGGPWRSSVGKVPKISPGKHWVHEYWIISLFFFLEGGDFGFFFF